MFRALGFDPEALLTGQVRDRDGELLDLMILAHTARTPPPRSRPPGSPSVSIRHFD